MWSGYKIQVGLLTAAACTAVITLSISLEHVLHFNTDDNGGGFEGVPTATKTYTGTYTTTTTAVFTTTSYYTSNTIPFTDKSYGDITSTATIHYLATTTCSAGGSGAICDNSKRATITDGRDPAPAAVTDVPRPTLPSSQHSSAVVIRDHPVRQAPSHLDKRRRKGGGSYGGSGGYSDGDTDPATIAVILTVVWAAIAGIWAAAHLVTSYLDIDTKLVSVKVDYVVLSLLVLGGLGTLVAAVELLFSAYTPAYMRYFKGLGLTKYLAGHIFGWILLAILLSLLIFELWYVRKRHGGTLVTLKSLRALSTGMPGPLAAHQQTGQVPVSNIDTKPGINDSSSYMGGGIPHFPNQPPSTLPPNAPLGGQWVYHPHPIHPQATGYTPPGTYNSSLPPPSMSPPPGPAPAAGYYGQTQQV